MLRAITLLLTATLSGVAFAEDAPLPGSPTTIREPVAVGQPNVDWTGPSVGLGFGYVPDAEGEDGFAYGVRLAYDYDFGDFIVGGIIEYGGADIDFDNGTDVDSVLRLGIRGGFDSGLNWYYASAGYTEIDTSGENSLGDGDGYFLGLGYERFVGERLTLGADLIYSDVDDFDDPDVEVDSATLGVSLNLRF